jgi:CRP/FNR family transcriptional regulator, cyclic AMP receptor protein
MQDRVTHSLVGALRAVPSFGRLDDRALICIVGDSANLFWRAGSVVFEQGTPADGLYVVVSGAVRVLDAAGTELNVLGPGDFFGELSLLDGSPHGHTVVALEDSELLVVAKERFDELLAAAPELRRTVQETAAERRAASARAAAPAP